MLREKEEAKLAERAKIVAWLRRRAAWLQDEIRRGGTCYVEMEQATAIANMIERERHYDP